MDTQFYYIDSSGQTLGPTDEAFILELRADGVLTEATHLNIVGSPDWKSLGELFPTEEVSPPPPPPPPTPQKEPKKPIPPKKIFIDRNDEHFGPYSVEDAKKYLESGELSPSDEAIWEGSTDQHPLERLLASVEPSPEPSRPKMADPYGDSNSAEQTRPQIANPYGDSSGDEPPLDIDHMLAEFKNRSEDIRTSHENKEMGQKVFFGTEIPNEKLIGAYAGYALEAKSKNDLNLILLDDTLSGNSKKGFLVTNQGVYFKNMLEKGSLIKWNQIQSIETKTGFLGSKILINHKQKIELQPWHGKVLPYLLEEAIRFLMDNVKLVGSLASVGSNAPSGMSSAGANYHPDLDINPEVKQAYSRHFLMLEEMLAEDEMVHALARGVGAFGKAGKELMAATNKRIFIFRQIVNLLVPQFENEEFYWSDIESVKVISGMIMSGIVLRTRGGEFSMKNVSSADAAGFAAFTTSHLQQMKSS